VGVGSGVGVRVFVTVNSDVTVPERVAGSEYV